MPIPKNNIRINIIYSNIKTKYTHIKYKYDRPNRGRRCKSSR